MSTPAPTTVALFSLVARGVSMVLDGEVAADPVDDQRLDYRELHELAHHHQVAPLVAARLRYDLPGAPAAARSAFARDTVANTQLALWQARQLVRLLARLEEAGVPAIVLKGLPLAARAYGSLGLRQQGDLDLLVPPSGMEAAVGVLCTEGYELALQHSGPEVPAAAFRSLVEDLSRAGRQAPPASGGVTRGLGRGRSGTRWATFLELGNELSFFHPDLGVVDLHWRPFRNGAYLQLDCWSHRSEVELEGEAVPVLEPVAELLYLVAHGAEHGWAHLKWLADLPCLVSRSGLALEEVAGTARQMGLEALTGSGLHLCAELFGSPRAEEVRRWFPMEPRAALLVEQARSRLSAWPVPQQRHPQVAELAYRLRLRGGAPYLARAVEDALVPANWHLDLAASVWGRCLRVPLCMADGALRERRKGGPGRRAPRTAGG